MTPLNCARVCRGYGYKFAALRDNTCTCGIQLPTGYEPSGSALCNRLCNGDNTQTCGGLLDAQILVDRPLRQTSSCPSPTRIRALLSTIGIWAATMLPAGSLPRM